MFDSKTTVVPIGKHPCTRKSAGFSAIELLVAIAIVGILAGLAAPSFVSTIERYRVNAVRDELISAIQLARIESVRRGAQVSIARKTNCGVNLSDNNDWSCGYDVFVDADTDGTLDNGETVVQSFTVPSGYTVTHTNQGASLRMNIWGLPQTTGHSFAITPPSGNQSTSSIICISAGGRIRSVSGSTTCS